MQIAAIPLDGQGNLMFIHSFRQEGERYFAQVGMPFSEQELTLVDNGEMYLIKDIGLKFSVEWIKKII